MEAVGTSAQVNEVYDHEDKVEAVDEGATEYCH
jgi:hypothetical protein